MAQTEKGAIMIAAKKAGLSVAEYTNRLAKGLKKCTVCKEWKLLCNFTGDGSRKDGRASKCIDCNRALWVFREITHGPQNQTPRRNGDKQQARRRINVDINVGIRPNPNSLYCSMCGHIGDDKRHEYHHILGYSPEHHCDVLPLCSACHRKAHAKTKTIK